MERKSNQYGAEFQQIFSIATTFKTLLHCSDLQKSACFYKKSSKCYKIIQSIKKNRLKNRHFIRLLSQKSIVKTEEDPIELYETSSFRSVAFTGKRSLKAAATLRGPRVDFAAEALLTC